MAYIQQLLRYFFLFFVDVTLVDQENFEGVLGSVLGNLVDPVRLLQSRLPAESLNNAETVADYLLSIIYPGEGAGNLRKYRAMIIDRLNDGSTDDPVSAEPFSNLTVSNQAGTAYDTRVRASVALLLSLPYFQEQ